MVNRLRTAIVDWLSGVSRPAPGQTANFSVKLGALEIGTLAFDGEQWVFSYSTAFKNQTTIKPITAFPDVNKEYRQADLWPFFLLRIPSTEQPEVKRYIEQHTDAEPDEVDMLRQFGRRSASNPFELLPAA